MSKYTYAIAALVVLGLVLVAMPVLHGVSVMSGDFALPVHVKANVGELAIVTADSKSPVQFWTDAPGAYVDAERRTVIVSSARPGQFRVLAWSIKWFRPTPAQHCTVEVGGVAPTPPGPTPPGPVPPVPPISPLGQKLQAAYNLDRLAGVGTLEQVAKLAEVYRHASEKVPGQMELKTLADLYGVLARTADVTVGPKDRVLPALRLAISGYLKVALPTKPDTPLSSSLRETAAGVFDELAKALGEVR